MFDRTKILWAVGRQTLNAEGTAWAGICIYLNRKVVTLEGESFIEQLSAWNEECDCIVGTCLEEFARTWPGHVRPHHGKLVSLELLQRAGARRPEQTQPKVALRALARLLSGRSPTAEAFAECLRLLNGVPTEPCFQSEAVAGTAARLHALAYALLRRLSRRGELRSLIKYELPAWRVLLGQAQTFIAIDAAGLAERVEHLDSRYRTLRASLLTSLGFDVADLWSSADLRSKILLGYLSVSTESPGLSWFLDALELASSRGGEISRIHEAMHLQRNLLTLQQLKYLGSGNIHPSYSSIGTITGRIIMREPGLQWLAKEDRRFVTCDSERTIRYFDFKSFEPTILAVHAKDKYLLSCAEDDLYSIISVDIGAVQLGGSAREFAKRFFLGLLYGRSLSKLSEDLAGAIQCSLDEAEVRIQGLVAKIPSSIAFRSDLEARARSTRVVCTPLGRCRRIGAGQEYLALSHYLQAMGAFIFKAALTAVFSNEDAVHLIAPMHDGLVCSLPRQSVEDACKRVKEQMERASESVLGRRVRVTIAEQF